MNRHNSFTFSFKENILFLIKCIFMLLIILSVCLHIIPQYEGSYMASLEDKVERLETLQDPKIVLLGNSNVAFGIRSEQIEESFGMPVVNTGLHGAMGNALEEELAKVNVQRGDIYILCHTTYSDNGSIFDPVVVWTAMEDHLDLWKLLRKEDLWPMYKSFPTYLKKCIELCENKEGNNDSGGVYSRSAMNQYGDEAEYRAQYDGEMARVSGLPKISDNVVERINELNRYLTDRGAVLLIAGYPIIDREDMPQRNEYEAFQTELANRLECPVISDYTDYIYDSAYFYDTDLHLTTEGAKIRTEQLIADLKKWQKRS